MKGEMEGKLGVKWKADLEHKGRFLEYKVKNVFIAGFRSNECTFFLV